MSVKDIPLTSSELATLWVVYQKKSMMVCVINYFLLKEEDEENKQLLKNFVDTESGYVKEIADIFREEGGVPPVGFGEGDINQDAPPLYDGFYDVMYLRLMMKIAMGLHALHLSMTYRGDIISLYRKYLQTAEDVYGKTTNILLQKGILARSPLTTMPQKVEFVKDMDYLTGMNPLKKKRSLNTLEVAYLFSAIESNTIGRQMITGYAQVADNKEVAKYFLKGKELTKKIITDLNNLLLASDVMAPISSTGHVTDSKVSPFSDKLMMYNIALITSFSLGSGALGSSFSLRGDLPVTMALLGQDIYNFSKEGGKLMATHGWMEEPPQMEDRNNLIQ